MSPLIQLIISQIPAIAEVIREARRKEDPDAPILTSQEILDGFETLFASEITKDEAIRAALKAELGIA